MSASKLNILILALIVPSAIGDEITTQSVWEVAKSLVSASAPAVPDTVAAISSLAKAGEYRLLGLSASQNPDDVVLSCPLANFIVPVDAIEAYRVSDDPAKLLRDVGEVTYLVTFEGRTISRAIIRRRTNGWSVASLGGAPIAAEMTKALGESPRLDCAGFFTAEVPALHVRFLGRQRGTELVFTAISSKVSSVRKGETRSAREFFASLVDEAKQLQDYPR